MFELFIFICIIIFLAVIGSFIPIGNENSTVRRIPWVTFTIMGLCVLTYFGTLPGQAGSMKEVVESYGELEKFLNQNEALLADEDVRNKLVQHGLIPKEGAEQIKEQLRKNPEMAREYESWLVTAEALRLRDEFSKKLMAYVEARKGTVNYRYGFAPNGEWKVYQLITCAFLHGGYEHLFGNMIFFFAIAFVLEDYWGRGVFLGFYLMGAAASCIPYIVSPSTVPLIGASGAISATMGAFLIRLPRTKIKLLFWPGNFLGFVLARKRMLVMVPSYLFLISYFIENLILWYFNRKNSSGGGTAFSAHISGFIYGALFAAVMKATKYEETVINPKIEAKVSFAAPQAVQQGLEMMDQGKLDIAERTLRSHLMKDHDNLEAILALIHVYEKQQNYDQLNVMYGRLIRYHLQRSDKEAALLAYDNLLTAFPDNAVCPRIPPRDWMVICDYLREAQMNREAAVEYERLSKAWPDDANTARALVQGAECALAVLDPERALRMFEQAEKLSPPQALASKIFTGLEKCHRILENHPNFKKRNQPKKPIWT
ncbi:MAG TPA: rhomboid family intramembrane serine protease [Blastocatellia bacterium]|nr:rhomboid family intramembrane serine protease [Blastocatellia bacterium]